MSGTLFVCATPIGNLEDITLRALRILKEVGLIAAEDTRQTQKLLNHYNISTPLTSYYKHNEIQKGKLLIQKLKEGKNIALVSDAGTPGLSDPGEKLIKRCIKEDIKVEVIPGASAAISALVISGLSTASYTYFGFLPRKKGELKKTLQKIKDEERTLVFFEAPHRIIKTLEEITQILGDRKVTLVRELTKKFEEVVRGSVSEVLAYFKEKEPKGEIVLIVEGATKEKFIPNEKTIKKEVKALIKEGITKKEAIKQVSEKREIPKRVVYKVAQDILAK